MVYHDTYNVFYKLFESIVCPVIMYGAPIWGTECFSCIQAVQSRAARYFLNVGKYTPVAAVNGDTAWYPLVQVLEVFFKLLMSFRGHG